MKTRCLNPNSKFFRYYGGRGVRVCDRWLVFENFLSDMGERPFARAEVDRIDPDGHYEPGNCRWADRRSQMNNRRNNFYVEFNGERMTLTQFSERVGINMYVLRSRLLSGESPELAASRPARKIRRRERPLSSEEVVEIRRAVAAGEPQSAIAARIGCDKSVVSRVGRGLLRRDVA